MGEKMADTRFTLQFSRTDPTHLQVAEILNRQGRRSKAQYIVNAVLHYENCDGKPNAPRSTEFDVKTIEAVVNRLLQEKEISVPEKTKKSTPKKAVKKPNSTAEEINFDDAIESLGADGLNAVAGAMEMFRKK